ncbi:MAG: 23S rRNA pseudouridine(1911/1915/1917) synthase RluD [Gammaproteobacteria bacterium]|nr:23S rRNA pseudouridine(1911/1915/1917) synthase RluD [Gammaproteobacteria bacterium]
MSQHPKNDDLNAIDSLDGWSEDDSTLNDTQTNVEIDDSPDDALPDDFGLHAHPATHIVKTAVVDDSLIGLRFDQVAALLFSEFSREKLKEWMLAGDLKFDGKIVKPKSRALGGEKVDLDVTLAAQTRSQPEEMALDIVYEDDQIIVINKPAGLVVHPGVGNWSGTLVNGLLHHDPRLAELPRAGLVHRIDKDTSGLLVIAKTLVAQHSLSQQLAEKSVFRIYDAVAVGHVIAGGTIDEPIRRHSTDRLKMAVQHGGRDSVTHYRVAERFGAHTLLRVQLETGRTHQIRVHMSYIGFPLVGDATYGGRARLPRGITAELVQTLQQFKRQALHARELGLVHPVTGEEMHFEAPWPDDFTHLVKMLRKEAQPDLGQFR